MNAIETNKWFIEGLKAKAMKDRMLLDSLTEKIGEDSSIDDKTRDTVLNIIHALIDNTCSCIDNCQAFLDIPTIASTNSPQMNATILIPEKPIPEEEAVIYEEVL